MKKLFSPEWKSSAQPRKQRKYRYNAPLHLRHKMLSSHLSRELRKEYGRRALPVRKGDEVVVMSGSFRGSRGKVSRVDLKELKVYVETVKRKKVSGREVEAPLNPGILLVTKLNLDDRERKKILERKREKK